MINRWESFIMPKVENGRKSFVQLATALYILKILKHNGPTHGNKMAEEIRMRTNQIIDPNPNNLYPGLRIMEERGYIKGVWDSPDRRNKRVYEITEQGIAHLPVMEERLKQRIIEIEANISIIKTDLLD
jgi:DNA-binding PadR family transcriptional regulator